MTRTTQRGGDCRTLSSKSRKSDEIDVSEVSVAVEGESGTSERYEAIMEAADIGELVPGYLRDFIQHYHGDFYATRCFDPRLVAQLMAEGFLPIATRHHLLPKLHEERCVLRLAPVRSPLPPAASDRGDAAALSELPGGGSDMHVPRSVRKKARRFDMTLNRDFDGVVAGCHAQHGINWLYPQVVAAFRFINASGKTSASGGDGNVAAGDSTSSAGGGVEVSLFDESGGSPQRVGSCPVRLYSVEVYNASTRSLVAGELGYTVGSIYTSLTGFSKEESSGSVQLAALGTLLERCGFTMWDLGMSMEYKNRLGARSMGRTAFVEAVHRARVETPDVRLTMDAEDRRNCRDILDGILESRLRNDGIISSPAS